MIVHKNINNNLTSFYPFLRNDSCLGLCTIFAVDMSRKSLSIKFLTINNCFTGTVNGNYLTEGSRDQFGLKTIPNVARDSFESKLVKGTRG